MYQEYLLIFRLNYGIISIVNEKEILLWQNKITTAIIFDYENIKDYYIVFYLKNGGDFYV